MDDHTERQARHIIRRAAELIREDGWCQGMYQDDGGRRCLLGALSTAAGRGHGEIYSAAKTLVSRALFLPNDHPLSSWNDAPGRTQREVLIVLDSLDIPADPRSKRALLDADYQH